MKNATRKCEMRTKLQSIDLKVRDHAKQTQMKADVKYILVKWSMTMGT